MKIQTIVTPRTERVDVYVRDLLANKLPKDLYYHDATHTLHPVRGVVARTDAYAVLEQVNNYEREILSTAAYLHDTGFTIRRTNNEVLAAEMSADFLPKLGYGSDEIEKVQGLIMDTRLEVNLGNPKTLLGKILCDADVDNLGRDDFMEKGQLLKAELGIVDDVSWLRTQANFLEKHRYHTNSARALRDDGKARNLENVYKRLAEYGLHMKFKVVKQGVKK
jgi:uncharacterized protein